MTHLDVFFVSAFAAATTACIIPDRDIQIDPGIDNLSAVRIVTRPPQLDEMHDICNRDPKGDPPPDYSYCPEVRRTSVPPGVVRPSEGSFCVCPLGDRRTLDPFEIYAEDGDRERDRPKDRIYAAALLDPQPGATNPSDAVAYSNYLEPGRAGELIEVNHESDNDNTAAPVGRRVLDLSVFPFDDGSHRIDLCNDNEGSSVGVGIHNLRVMVTDRPFFRERAFVDGAPAVTADGKPAYYPTQWGVPDLAAGATYATVDYVFECLDPEDETVKAHDDYQRMLDPDDPDDAAQIEPRYCECVSPDGGG
ncbi:MAG TPA: hypothetical protein VG755_34935 [Nannocystaceae bacterium]|nr:hypothetical protein [Nannocystaceae bacterium]